LHFPLSRETNLIRENESIIWQDGAPSGQPAEILFLKREDDFALFKLGSGLYSFRSETPD
jgi:hypothetical protein